MLPKKNRANKKDIKKIFKDGSFLNSPNLTFKFLTQKEANNFKISFIVPKTISKKAIIRNKLRRMGYNALKKIKIKSPIGLVGAFIFSRNSLSFLNKSKEISFLNLENEIKLILSKLNVLNNIKNNEDKN